MPQCETVITASGNRCLRMATFIVLAACVGEHVHERSCACSSAAASYSPPDPDEETPR